LDEREEQGQSGFEPSKGKHMALPESYTFKTSAIPAYFDAILDAQPPDRFSLKFLENLGFSSTNDRLFIGILKDLGFLNRDGVPQQRYFDFLDRGRSKQVLAEGIRESFGDLFAVNTKANEMKVEDVKNKLRTMYAGGKTNLVIAKIANTFRALCDYADFSAPPTAKAPTLPEKSTPVPAIIDVPQKLDGNGHETASSGGRVQVSALQYHINIVLPDSRDQAVYDAIFKSLREHLS
jgi:hypothetical protein